MCVHIHVQVEPRHAFIETCLSLETLPCYIESIIKKKKKTDLALSI